MGRPWVRILPHFYWIISQLSDDGNNNKLLNEHEMSIYELFHFLLFLDLFIVFAYNKEQSLTLTVLNKSTKLKRVHIYILP